MDELNALHNPSHPATIQASLDAEINFLERNSAERGMVRLGGSMVFPGG